MWREGLTVKNHRGISEESGDGRILFFDVVVIT